jgi:phospholipid/cholesterol/gamma-HCH transport system substrate-binding protein
MTEVTLRSEYNLNQQSAKNYLRLRIIPKPDKYYLLEVVDDPRGVTEEETIQRDPPGENQLQRQTLFTTKQDLKFSAQIAKRYYFLTLRFGLIESSGGVGANLHFLNDNLSLNVDLFEITSRDKEYPRLKAYVNYAFLGHLFFTVGMDDIFNSKEEGYRGASSALTQVSGRDFFVGGGIYFTDDDLKAILSSVPIP